jgi:hypothetical protein
VNKIDDSYNKAMEALDAQLDAMEEEPEQVTPKASQRNKRVITPKASQAKKWAGSPKVSQKTKLAIPPASQKDSKGQFVIPAGSQQIDLTLSSDVEPVPENDNDGDDSYNDDFGLPTGPGWVEKKSRNTRRQSSAVTTRAASQSGSQRRTTRRKTMTKF